VESSFIFKLLLHFLNSKVYKEPRPTTIPELQDRIREECANIPQALIIKAIKSMQERAHKLVEKDGSHFE